MQNAVADVLIVGLSNSAFEIIGGFSAFGVAGFLNLDPAVDKLGSFVLGFYTYPSALARLPGSQIFSIIFFFTLFLLGLSSAFALVEGMVTLAQDSQLIEKRFGRSVISFIVCGVGIFASLLYSSDVGQGFLGAVDKYTNDFALPFVAFSETFAVAYIYRYRDVVDQVGMIAYGLHVFGYLGAMFLGIILGYAHSALAGLVGGLVLYVGCLVIAFIVAKRPTIDIYHRSPFMNRLYWVTFYQADQLRKDLNAVVATGHRWKIPVLWSILLKYVTGPTTLILTSFALSDVGETLDEPIQVFGLCVGLVAVFFTIVGLMFPRFFEPLLPKGEKSIWKDQFEVGSAVVLYQTSSDGDVITGLPKTTVVVEEK